MIGRAGRLLAFALALAGATAAWAQTPSVPAPAATQVTAFRAAAAPFTDDDQTLVEVRVDRYELSNALSAYSSRAGVYIPLGELCRLLDLAVTVYPPEQRAAGWILIQSRTISVDMTKRTAKVGDQTIAIGADQGAFQADDIYLRLDLLQKLLPIDFKFDARGLVLALAPREALPFQQRLEREQRKGEIGGHTDKVSVLKVNTPYLAFTPPTVDVSLQGGGGLTAPHETGQYEVRAAGDFAFASLQAFAGSDSSGRLDDVRLTLGRKDPAGHVLGPVGGSDFEVGDTFTPTLSLGERGQNGRGAYFTSAPLETTSVFSHLDLRGELPVGYQVELYVNEVLQGSVTTPTQGRYEFLDVPLSFGANTIRLVFYGPHGEQRQEVRHYNFGGGQVEKGRLVVSLGAVQQGDSVVTIPPAPVPGATGPTPAAAGQGSTRVAAELQYGLTSNLTLTGGFARYEPLANQTRQVVEAGARTSFSVLAIQVDAAKDVTGGQAESLEVAGRLAGVSFLSHEIEYQGVFYDETERSGVTAGDPLRRVDQLRLDWSQPVFWAKTGLPMDLNLERDERQDGSELTTAEARFSSSLAGYLVAASLSYSGSGGGSAGASNTFGGEIEASRLFGKNWQIRGGVQYQVVPSATPQSGFINLDHSFSNKNSLRLSVSQAFTSGYDTTAQVSDTWHLRRADVAITAGFDTQKHDLRLGLQIGFGFLFDPSRGAYRLVRPGASAGGDASFTAFIDSNGDGIKEKGETALPDVKVESQGAPVKTDASGEAILTGLGDGSVARIRVKTDDLDAPYAIPPADVVEFIPRPGRVAQVFYGLKPVGEVQLRLLLRKADGSVKGVAALHVQLVTKDGRVAVEGRTEYDGTMFLEKLPPGEYFLRLEPEQSKRLGLSLAAARAFTIPPAGGYVGDIEDDVVAAP